MHACFCSICHVLSTCWVVCNLNSHVNLSSVEYANNINKLVVWKYRLWILLHQVLTSNGASRLGRRDAFKMVNICPFWQRVLLLVSECFFCCTSCLLSSPLLVWLNVVDIIDRWHGLRMIYLMYLSRCWTVGHYCCVHCCVIVLLLHFLC